MEERKKELLKIARQSHGEGLLVGTSGNLSAYNPESGVMVITPAGVPYEIMGLSDLVLMTLDGEVLSGHRKPSVEWRLHAAIYRERPDVQAVIHTHSPYAEALAVNAETLPVILCDMAVYLGGDVKTAPFALPGTEGLGRAALQVLDGRGACLLQNHGTVLIGESLEEVHLRAVYLEDAARVYAIAKSHGTVHVIPDELISQIQKLGE